MGTYDHWKTTNPEDDFDETDSDDFDELMQECGLGHDGQCSMAGTEHCDFVCPMRDSEDFCGSAAWRKKHDRPAR
jgi:hypothetical protein